MQRVLVLAFVALASGSAAAAYEMRVETTPDFTVVRVSEHLSLMVSDIEARLREADADNDSTITAEEVRAWEESTRRRCTRADLHLCNVVRLDGSLPTLAFARFRAGAFAGTLESDVNRSLHFDAEYLFAPAARDHHRLTFGESDHGCPTCVHDVFRFRAPAGWTVLAHDGDAVGAAEVVVGNWEYTVRHRVDVARNGTIAPPDAFDVAEEPLVFPGEDPEQLVLPAPQQAALWQIGVLPATREVNLYVYTPLDGATSRLVRASLDADANRRLTVVEAAADANATPRDLDPSELAGAPARLDGAPPVSGTVSRRIEGAAGEILWVSWTVTYRFADAAAAPPWRLEWPGTDAFGVDASNGLASTYGDWILLRYGQEAAPAQPFFFRGYPLTRPFTMDVVPRPPPIPSSQPAVPVPPPADWYVDEVPGFVAPATAAAFVAMAATLRRRKP